MRAPVLAVVLTASLALSLALNAWLLFFRRPAPPPRPAPVATAPAPEACMPSPEAEACAAELSRCRSQGWDLMRKVIEAQRRTAAPPASTAAAAPVAKGDVGAKQQREALCAKGLESLRATWRGDRDLIVANLRASLANPEVQERDTSKEVATMADTLGLAGSARDGMERDYRAVRQNRVRSMVDAMRSDPPDLDGALGTARAMFADEDRIAGRYGGEAGRLAWRRNQLDSRTVLLAVGAAMADKELDDSMAW